MPGEVNKPASLTYWTARNGDGSVLHLGETTPDLVTTSGQPVFEPDTDASAHLVRLATVAQRLPVLPARGQEIEPGRYRDGEDVVLVKERHVRGAGDDTVRVVRATVPRDPTDGPARG